MRCILLAFAGHATAVAKASSDPPWHSLRVSEPRPGGQFKSPIAVNLNVLLVPGLSSEVQAHAEQYQVCYTGGVRAICTLFGGNGSKVRAIDMSALGRSETEDAILQSWQIVAEDVHNSEGVELIEQPSFEPNRSYSSDSNYAGTSSGSGFGVIRAWVSHVSKPLVALGPTDAVFAWRDPRRAEVELRRRLDFNTADSVASAQANIYGVKRRMLDDLGELYSDVGAILWSHDVESEAKAERARLLYHLGICLHQQITRLAKIEGTFDGKERSIKSQSNGSNVDADVVRHSIGESFKDGSQGWAGVLQRGRVELAIAATEALSRAHALGLVQADSELEALRLEMAEENKDAESVERLHSIINGATEDEIPDVVSNLDSNASIATVTKASSNLPWFTLRTSMPKPGDQLESPIAVNLRVSLVPGLSSELQAYMDQYQVCYTGGARTICTLFGGNVGRVRAIDISELRRYSEDGATVLNWQIVAEDVHNSEGVELIEQPSFEPNRSYSSDSNYADTSGTSSGSGFGVIRAWVSHVSKPLVALGPTDAVFVWRDPRRAEVELRRRLDANTKASAEASAHSSIPKGSANNNDDSSGAFDGIDRVYSDVGAVLWSFDKMKETEAEKARLLYHLGVCLHQQITSLATTTEAYNATGSCVVGCSKGSAKSAGNEGSRDFADDYIHDGSHGWAGASRRGRFELAMAATEALSRAHALGLVQADSELKAVRIEVAGEDDEEAESNKKSDSIGSETSKDGLSDSRSNPDSDENIARLLNDVALITISNSGYSDYTLNTMASLRIRCRLPCVLQVVCLDQTCVSKLSHSFEVRQCAELPIHLASGLFEPTSSISRSTEPSADGSEFNEEHLSAFANYNTDSFNVIVRNKFMAITYFLARKRVVVYTDGDVVFLRRSFLRETVAPLGKWRSGSGGSQLELLAQCDADHSMQRCDLDVCSGFMAILSTSDTRRLFDPAFVFADAKYQTSFEDQTYLYLVVPGALPGRVDTLPRRHFPNGAFRYGSFFNITRARMIHFNYNVGHMKAEQMAEEGLWFIDSTTGDTGVEYQQSAEEY